jgi:hypothetical protein
MHREKERLLFKLNSFVAFVFHWRIFLYWQMYFCGERVHWAGAFLAGLDAILPTSLKCRPFNKPIKYWAVENRPRLFNDVERLPVIQNLSLPQKNSL